MYRASDRVTEQEWLEQLEDGADELALGEEARAVAIDLYLSELPVPERSKPSTLAASCYTAALISGEERSQSAVADAFGVSRLSVQNRWKSQIEAAGLTPPSW